VINVSIDAKELNRMSGMLRRAGDQLAFATSVAINRTIRDAYLALNAQVSKSFIDPTPYTQAAFRYTPSTKASLEGDVYLSPDRSYLLPQIFGGQRRWKDYEGFIRGLDSQRALPPGKLLPTQYVKDKAGNPRRNIFSLIESNISSSNPGGVFIGKPKGGNRSPGVYRRSRGRLYPYFLASKPEPIYSAIFPFERIGRKTISSSFPLHFQSAVTLALESAK
jgi:hypothetical protein